MFKSIRNIVQPLNIKCWFNTIFFLLFINNKIFVELKNDNSFIKYLIELNIDLQISNFSLFKRIFYIRENLKKKKLLKFILEQDEPKLKTELELTKNRNCSNLPFFELFIINFLNRLGLNVMDIIYMDVSSVYLYYSIYYTYEILPDINFITQKLFNATNIQKRLMKIQEYFLQDNLKKLNVLVVSHYDYNHQLTMYFNALRALLDLLPEPMGIKASNIADNITELKFNNTNGSNYINRHFSLFACILRNYNATEKQKTILAFISSINRKQYIIHDLRKNNIIQEFVWLRDNKFTEEELEITKDSFTYKYNFSKGEKILLYLNTTNKEQLLKEENDEKINLCTDITVIPQFGGTCWFNAILTVLLYSQGSRNVLFKEAKNWDKQDSLFMLFKTILYNSHSPDDNKREKLRQILAKIKPEAMLLKTVKRDVGIYEQFKLNKQPQNIYDYGFFTNFIIPFLKILNLNFLDITYFSNGCILSFYKHMTYRYDTSEKKLFSDHYNYDNVAEKEVIDKQLEKGNPDYLILFHHELMPISLDISTEYISKYISATDYITDGNLNKIKHCEDIIIFNGSYYKLDSCLLGNYNSTSEGHAIAGITCNDNKFVYNGWNDNKIPCHLFPFNWNVKKLNEFCFNPTDICKLLSVDKSIDQSKDLCFSFNKGERILIYVKLDVPHFTYNTISNGRSSVNQNSLSNLSVVVDDLFDYLDNYSKDELIALLRYFNYTDVQDKSNNKLLKILKYKIKHDYFNISIKPIEISQSQSRVRRTSRRRQTRTQTVI